MSRSAITVRCAFGSSSIAAGDHRARLAGEQALLGRRPARRHEQPMTGEELVVGGQEAVRIERRARRCPRPAASAANGTLRRSRGPARIATFVRMRKIQVLSEERPSKPSIPRITAIQVSCTASSATARLGT